MVEVIIVEAKVSIYQISVPTQIQQQLEAPLQRKCASVGSAAAVVCKGGESGSHAGPPDAVETAG
ncbi:hypothetical protein D3C75_1242140 [compost metagenome]